MVSSGSPGVPGSSSGVAGAWPGAVTVPGAARPWGRDDGRSARPAASSPAPAGTAAVGSCPGRRGRRPGRRGKAPPASCAAGLAGGPALPEGKAGRAGRGVVPGGDLVRDLAVAGGGGSRPGCRPAGRAGLPPGTAGIQPPLRPPRQVVRAVPGGGLDTRPHRATGRCGPVPAPLRGGGGPGGGSAARQAPQGHGGAHRDGARHRRPRAWYRAAGRYGRARLRAARYADWRICHGPLPCASWFSVHYRNRVSGAFFHPASKEKSWWGRETRLLREVRLPPSAFHVPRAPLPCTWRETTPVSCPDIPGRERRRAAAAGRGYAPRDRRSTGLGQCR
jgi:hypothetical protein